MEVRNYEVNSEDHLNLKVPSKIKKWNWGAFMFNIIWGIGNKSYLPLLCLIPFFNIVWVFVCGFKGNSWAFKNGNYTNDDVDKFLEIQATWNRAGIASFILTIAIIILYAVVLASLFSAFNSSFYYY